MPAQREVSLSRKVSLFVVAIGSVVLAGCGSSAGASAPTKVAARGTTSTAVSIGPTPTSLPSSFPTASPTSKPDTTATILPTPTLTRTARATVTSPTPTVTAPAALAAPKLMFVSVRPLTVAASGILSVTVQTAGAAQRAELYLGSGAPNAPSPSTFPLGETSPGKWSGSGAAPAVAGTYHFTVGLYNPSGRRFLIDNDAWNLQVQGGAAPPAANATASGVKPLFSDIPLAPPFSYGNPVEAVFNANGRTVNGSEVVSNTRTDVPASVVAQYYSVHFPRSGWSTSGGTVPAGATSFSMSATSGSRVCIVQFAAGTVHIFYG